MQTTPWILAKDENEKDKLQTVLYNLLESIRCATVLLQAYIPSTAERIFGQLNTEMKEYETAKEFNKNNVYKLNKPEILFARIDVK